MVGPVLATVRVITVFSGRRAIVSRAFWKVPLGDGVTDHPRLGNGAAAVDLQSGEIGPVSADPAGCKQRVDVHPDTGAALAGVLPHWPGVRAMTERAAEVFHVLPLIGWDVALCAQGPVIVEANTSPSLDLPQYLTGTGALAEPGGDQLRRLAQKADKARASARRSRRKRRWKLLCERVGLKRSPTQL